MLSHQLKRNVIDGEKAIIQNPTEQQRYRSYSLHFRLLTVYMLEATVAQTIEAKLLKNYLCKVLLLPLTNVAYNL